MAVREAHDTRISDLAARRLERDGGAILIADWTPAVFIHYAVEPDALQPLVPFPLDLHDGRAYVSVVAFVQHHLRPKVGGRVGALLSRPLATHPFCNVRTYVVVDGEPGIYFLAEWIPNRLAALLGPPLYGLPYRLGTLNYDIGDAEALHGEVRAAVGTFRFHARRSFGDLDEALGDFLVERYTAFTLRGRTPLRFRIDHEPWAHVPVDVDVEDDSLLGATGNWRRRACLICGHHSPGLRGVRIGRPRKLCAMPNPLVRWAPVALLPPLAGLALLTRLPAWACMWAMAYAIFFGCKWATLLGAGEALRRTAFARILAYLFAWPGMEMAPFLEERTHVSRASGREWLAAMAKPASGGILLFAVAGQFAHMPLVAGWIGMIGAILLLHFGLFHLLALAFRGAGIDVAPIMNAPLRSRSVAEFWGTRWNLGFHELANQLVFRPTVARLGVAGALLLTFFASGVVHELVITVPARGGYGLPTLYFVLQGLGLLIERRILRRRRLARRAFALAVVGLPAFVLFPPPFVLNVFVPFMRAIGAMLKGACVMTNLDTLIRIGGVLHLGILIASALVPGALEWKRELQQLRPLSRQLIWVHGAFIVLTIIGLGVISLIAPVELAAGTVLGRAVCAFVAIFWLARLGVQFFVFDATPFLTRPHLKIGYHALTVVFFVLVVIYGFAAFAPRGH